MKSDPSDTVLWSVPYITLRNRTGSDNPSEFFGDERDSVHTGYCEVLHKPLQALQSIAEKAPFYIPDRKMNLKAIREVPANEFWRNMVTSADDQNPVLYLHGYNIGFEKGCKRASLFQSTLNLAGRFLLFSWPSDGAMLNYTRDEADLYWSVAPLQETLIEMAERFGAGGFDVVAHSLGARAAFLALIWMNNNKNLEKPLLNQLVLIAPDIDTGIFEQYRPQLLPLVYNLTVYVSVNDSPLKLSREVHGYPRLGQVETHLDSLEGVEIIDVSDIGKRRASGHLYHLYHELVAGDLMQLLTDGKSASRRSNLQKTGENRWRLLPH